MIPKGFEVLFGSSAKLNLREDGRHMDMDGSPLSGQVGKILKIGRKPCARVNVVKRIKRSAKSHISASVRT